MGMLGVDLVRPHAAIDHFPITLISQLGLKLRLVHPQPPAMRFVSVTLLDHF